MQPYILGIAGGSASGKTYLVKKVREYFDESKVCILTQDDYYKSLALQVKDDKGEINFDVPEAIDAVALSQDLEQLKAGRNLNIAEYTFNNPGSKPVTKKVIPAPVILIEGFFIFHLEKIFTQLDLKIFVDARDDIKLARRLERDTKERGLTTELILYQWHNHVYPAYRKYLLPYRDEADLIITNNYSTEKGVQLLCDHIEASLDRLKG